MIEKNESFDAKPIHKTIQTTFKATDAILKKSHLNNEPFSYLPLLAVLESFTLDHYLLGIFESWPSPWQLLNSCQTYFYVKVYSQKQLSCNWFNLLNFEKQQVTVG